ncbi:hypothetical protein GCM10010472_41640 [Pseudonocardia halophobica]|uniref:Uncharacterized protein n=1 Tax=Pseudonocardia halophobica TaxID=29401 RepID=A0A9W6NX34_9PSEU|nr:hypothetical protein [Pseudonocardia halophobica]GLL12479.1 hypothetical protein GCM10017577_36200 [Pseudonocardia halophobica]
MSGSDAEKDERSDAGDPVCWLHRLCPTCGAMPTDDPAAPPDRCWRCGEPFAEG